MLQGSARAFLHSAMPKPWGRTCRGIPKRTFHKGFVSSWALIGCRWIDLPIGNFFYISNQRRRSGRISFSSNRRGGRTRSRPIIDRFSLRLGPNIKISFLFDQQSVFQGFASSSGPTLFVEVARKWRGSFQWNFSPIHKRCKFFPFFLRNIFLKLFNVRFWRCLIIRIRFFYYSHYSLKQICLAKRV